MSDFPKKMELNEVLFGRERGEILRMLFGNPEQPYDLQQIAIAVGTKQESVDTELTLLVDHGLLDSTRIDGDVFYRPNQQSPVFAELMALIAKAAGNIAINAGTGASKPALPKSHSLGGIIQPY